jgi:hypothetical protein
MQQFSQHVPYSSANLSLQLSALASEEAGCAPFLSCYLDATTGIAGCRDFLTERYLDLAGSMPESQRALLDEAVTMVDAAFAHSWPEGVRTIAVFARPGTKERCLQILPLIDAVPAQVSWYGLPQLLPAMETAASTTRFRLLLSRRHALHVVDVIDGVVKIRAWASPQSATNRTARDADLDPPAMGLRRALLERSSMPLVVGGAGPDLDTVFHWLPAHAKTRYVERVAVPDHLDFNQAVRFVIDDYEDRRRLEAQLEVSRLLRASRGHGFAVLGPLGCMEALRSGDVETLVLARDFTLPRIWHCDGCGADHACGAQPTACGVCDNTTLSMFDFAIEIGCLAKRKGVNVVFSDADELRYLGGVGCLLMQPADTVAMPLPARRRRLDLVA